MKRRIFSVGPDKKVSRSWVLKTDGVVSGVFRIKAFAMETARRRARNWFKKGGLAQLVVRSARGKLQIEYTYGKDPERSKG